MNNTLMPDDAVQATPKTSGLAARFNAYRQQHGNDSLTLFVGSGIYGGHYLCSHRDDQRAQVIELGERRIVNVPANVFDRYFDLVFMDEFEMLHGGAETARAFESTIKAMLEAAEFCMAHEKRLDVHP